MSDLEISFWTALGFIILVLVAIGINLLDMKIRKYFKKPKPKHFCKDCFYRGMAFYDLVTQDLFRPCKHPKRTKHDHEKARIFWNSSFINPQGECSQYRPLIKPECESWPECSNCYDMENPPCNETLLEQEIRKIFE